jgi:ATP-dependent 26S proteasome regulatory subunit
LLLPVPVPERGARESILRVHLQRLRYRDAAARDELIDWAATAVAAAAPIGCTSASLAAVARETGMNCLRRHLQGASTAEQAFVERRDVVDAARQVLQIEL